MKDPYVRTETVDTSVFLNASFVRGFFGEEAASYWHGMDPTTDRVIHLTPSHEWCLIRKISPDGRLPSKSKDPFLREIE